VYVTRRTADDFLWAQPDAAFAGGQAHRQRSPPSNPESRTGDRISVAASSVIPNISTFGAAGAQPLRPSARVPIRCLTVHLISQRCTNRDRRNRASSCFVGGTGSDGRSGVAVRWWCRREEGSGRFAGGPVL
jgi:hypothetical protein